MNRWLCSAIGLGGVSALVGKIFAPKLLGMPVHDVSSVYLTPHGGYGAPRVGPPVHKHQGVDFHAAQGEEVLAVGDGVIIAASPGLGGIVRKLMLEQPAAWREGAELVKFVVYADLGGTLVVPGDRVKKGDPIARVAKAGFVHFAVKRLSGSGSEEFFDPALAGFPYRGGAHASA